MRLVKTNIKYLFVLSDPTFRVNMQKWPKILYLFNLFVLIRGINEIVQSNNIFPHNLDIIHWHLVFIRSFSQLWFVNSGYIQQFGEKSPNDHLILVLWLFSIILHSNYSLELMR